MYRKKSGKICSSISDAADVVFTYLGLSDSTCKIERIWSAVGFFEVKRRAKHLGIESFDDAVRVSLETPKKINALVEQCSNRSYVNGKAVDTVWKPRALISKAQLKYAEFFGRRKLQSRSLAPLALKDRLAMKPRRQRRCEAAPKNIQILWELAEQSGQRLWKRWSRSPGVESRQHCSSMRRQSPRPQSMLTNKCRDSQPCVRKTKPSSHASRRRQACPLLRRICPH